METLNINQIKSGIWSLYDGEIRCFLFVGSERALLLDTGFGKIRIDKSVKELTDLPLIVMNTHAHPDHVLGDSLFDEIHINPAGMNHVNHPNLKPVTEGMVFDLGGIKLESIELPGHTPDGMALIDYEAKAIFTGDVVELERGSIRDLEAYIASLERLLTMKDKIEKIYPSHGECPIPFDSKIDDLHECLKAIKRGEIKGEPIHVVLPPDIDINTFLYRFKSISIFYNPELGDWA